MENGYVIFKSVVIIPGVGNATSYRGDYFMQPGGIVIEDGEDSNRDTWIPHSNIQCIRRQW